MRNSSKGIQVGEVLKVNPILIQFYRSYRTTTCHLGVSFRPALRMQQAASFPLLVQRSEECFASEHSSWVSSMSAQHGHRKTGNDEEDEKDKVTKVAPE